MGNNSRIYEWNNCDNSGYNEGLGLKEKTEIEENLKETFCLKPDQLAKKSKAQHNIRILLTNNW